MLDNPPSFLDLHCQGAVPPVATDGAAQELLDAFHGWDCIRFLGIRATFYKGAALTTIDPAPHHLGGRSGAECVNGPTILSIVDASMALIGLAQAYPAKVATINVNTDFMYPVPNAPFHCAAIATKRSKRLINCQAIVFGVGGPSAAASASGIVSVLA